MVSFIKKTRDNIVDWGNSTEKKRIIWNIIFILFIMLLPIIDAPSRKPTTLLFLKNSYVYADFVVHGLCIIFVYLNVYYFIPKLYLTQQKIIYFIISISIFAFIAQVPDFFEDNIYSYRQRTPEKKRIHMLIQIRHIFFLYFSLFFYSLYTVIERKRVETERLKNIAEVNFLKAQINPHFLFNTLNSIYALTKQNPEKAGEAIIKMSNLMRYVMNPSENDFIDLKNATQFVIDYIDLQKTRFGDTVEIEQEIDIMGDYKIAPLILLPFIENAFKYGVIPSKPSKITIQLYNKKEQLYFFVGNNNYSTIVSRENSTGIGVTNTIKRLEAIYGYNQEVKVKRTSKEHKVAITIKLQ